MKKIEVKMPVFKKTNITERGEILREFVSRISTTWDTKKYGKMTIPRMAKKLQGMSVQDMYYLKRVCEDSKDYSKRFFFEINPNKHPKV